MTEMDREQGKASTPYLIGALIGAVTAIVAMAAVLYLASIPWAPSLTHVGQHSVTKIFLKQVNVSAEKLSSVINMNDMTIKSATILEGPASITVEHETGDPQIHELPVGTKLVYHWSSDGKLSAVSILFP